MPKSPSIFIAGSITGQSESLPIIKATFINITLLEALYYTSSRMFLTKFTQNVKHRKNYKKESIHKLFASSAIQIALHLLTMR
jgi:hypothetical protein